eukprot:SAG25_NODE_4589_length_787_cov_0.825581_1_plen_179_part_10
MRGLIILSIGCDSPTFSLTLSLSRFLSLSVARSLDRARQSRFRGTGPHIAADGRWDDGGWMHAVMGWDARAPQPGRPQYHHLPAGALATGGLHQRASDARPGRARRYQSARARAGSASLPRRQYAHARVVAGHGAAEAHRQPAHILCCRACCPGGGGGGGRGGFTSAGGVARGLVGGRG